MDRLRLINTTRDIPLSLYQQGTTDELFMRRSLLHYRQRKNNLSTEGAPPYYQGWIHDLEWREHYDMPRSGMSTLPGDHVLFFPDRVRKPDTWTGGAHAWSRLQSYLSLDVVLASLHQKYFLIRFLNPSIYFEKIKA